MAIVLGKKPAVKEAPWEGENKMGEPTKKASLLQQAKTSVKSEHNAEHTKPVGSLLKRGKDAKETMAREDAKADARQKNQNLRFWVKEGTDAVVTFLDGNLDADGMLDIPYFYEHNEKIAGKYGNHYACTAEHEPCPVCEGGSQASYMGLLTIIDHREYEAKDGKKYKNQIRLFAAKRGTLKQLQKIAEKRGGLAGCQFDVSRTGAQSASVGSMFDFTTKLTESQITNTYSDNAKPLNYDEVVASITFSADELRKMGFGSMRSPIGSEANDDDDANYEGKL